MKLSIRDASGWTIFVFGVAFGYAPLRFAGVGIWELIGALASGTALYLEKQKAIKAGGYHAL